MPNMIILSIKASLEKIRKRGCSSNIVVPMESVGLREEQMGINLAIGYV